MSISAFVKYAAAFEEAFRSDDWAPIERFFTPDAVYEADLPAPMGGRFEGRDAILAYFKRVLDDFDRRFASREPSLVAGPRQQGNSVWLRGGVRYTAPGVPDLYFELEETLWFDGERIRRLADRYDEATLAALVAYLREHGPKLGIALDPSEQAG
jgi:hypothetical protein